ncbi:MAG: type II toxin-antitoxin system prevent-host-death family antitoxin [Clostridiaceae bacterium]
MIVNATDLKNNLGKYLRAAAREEVIVTSNGRKIARLTAYEDKTEASGSGSLIQERAELYALKPRKVSYEEFLEISENSEERYEYIDGEIYLLASPKAVHQQILGELYGILYNWFRGKSCRPLFAPFDITLKRNEENINIVQPDLMVICDLEEKLNEKNYYMGVPSLMVEILSESSRGKDQVKKLDLYMSTGVKEYWIINPFSREVTVFLFEKSDPVGSKTYKDGDNIASFIFDGLKVSMDSLFGSIKKL